MNVHVAADSRIGEDIHIAIDCTSWEYAALVSILADTEPIDPQEAHVLRALNAVLRPGVPARGTQRSGRAVPS